MHQKALGSLCIFQAVLLELSELLKSERCLEILGARRLAVLVAQEVDQIRVAARQRQLRRT